MSYKSKFKYNEAYSNTDIAEALSIITGTGIVPNTPSEILSNYASSGVTYADEQLNVSLSGTTVTVGCGAAIMDDGSYIIVYEPEAFTVSLTGTYYVYLKHNAVGDISVKCETSLPTDNDMSLATVANGVVEDKRKYATSKISQFGKSSLNKLALETSSYNNATYTLPNYNFSLIIFMYIPSKNHDIRAAIYNTANSNFLDGCNMLYDTGSSTSHKTVVSVSVADKELSVVFDNMSVENIKATAVYCV